jgi:hypothetical protein
MLVGLAVWSALLKMKIVKCEKGAKQFRFPHKTEFFKINREIHFYDKGATSRSQIINLKFCLKFRKHFKQRKPNPKKFTRKGRFISLKLYCSISIECFFGCFLKVSEIYIKVVASVLDSINFGEADVNLLSLGRLNSI